MKIVVNKCYGGFGISLEALLALIEKKSEIVKKYTFKEYYGSEKTNTEFKSFKKGYKYEWVKFYLVKDDIVYALDDDDENKLRSHLDLIELVEKLGEKANGDFADLVIVEIPDDVEWQIEEYDGNEHIAEKHRTW